MSLRTEIAVIGRLAICMGVIMTAGIAHAQFDPPELGESAAASGSSKVNLGALKEKHKNSLVKVEFTYISNLSTVKLNPTKSEEYYSGSEPPHGSGFFISETDIMTNAHVVEAARRSSIRIKSPATGNVEFQVEVVGLSDSEDLDLAILRLPPDEAARFKHRAGFATIPFLSLGSSEDVKQADSIAIFGYPESSDELKVIEATVTGRQYLKSYGGDWFVGGFKFIEVGPAAVIQPGNSGGPALSAAGEVVGIPARGSGWASEQGWIIPSDIAKHFLKQIYESEAGDKGLILPDLGVYFAENFEGNSVLGDADEDLVVFQSGIVVREVLREGLAERWGVKSGDIIVGFRNEDQRISTAIDFEGNTIVTGKFSTWPPGSAEAASKYSANSEKRHIRELFLMANPGDSITLSILRPGEKGLIEISQKLENVRLLPVPHLGTYQRPDFELWGEFVVQEFNSFNLDRFTVPRKEVRDGGVLVTYVEPNGLASRRGMKVTGSSFWFFMNSMAEDAETMQSSRYRDVTVPWVIVDEVNGKRVSNLAEFRKAVRDSEAAWTAKTNAPGYDPAKKLMMKERYVTIGFRTRGSDGETIRLAPAFPVDEAMETSLELLKNWRGK
jgi:S1-C subfamily serine protease